MFNLIINDTGPNIHYPTQCRRYTAKYIQQHMTIGPSSLLFIIFTIFCFSSIQAVTIDANVAIKLYDTIGTSSSCSPQISFNSPYTFGANINTNQLVINSKNCSAFVTVSPKSSYSYSEIDISGTLYMGALPGECKINSDLSTSDVSYFAAATDPTLKKGFVKLTLPGTYVLSLGEKGTGQVCIYQHESIGSMTRQNIAFVFVIVLLSIMISW